MSRNSADDWRDPTGPELESARSRYPDLLEDRLFRLARAEAKQVDMGIPQPKHREEMTREIAKAAGGPGGGDFERHTAARGEFFARVGPDGRTPSQRAAAAAGGDSIGKGRRSKDES